MSVNQAPTSPQPDAPPRAAALAALEAEIAVCRLCAARFAATATAHAPAPITRGSTTARLLVASQAPGARAHASQLFFDDPSGETLRDWMGVDRATFYDRARVAIAPMAFCFPGYDDKGADLPPPPVCARTWRARTLAAMPQVRLTLVVGAYAQKWHLGAARGRTVADTVAAWRDVAPAMIPLPHPSWRTRAWRTRHPWFEAALLPHLRAQVAAVL